MSDSLSISLDCQQENKTQPICDIMTRKQKNILKNKSH
jgi:hypothetical protein